MARHLKRVFLFSLFIRAVFANHESQKHTDYFHPEQIHLSFGEFSDELVVTWSTFNSTPNSIVMYGLLTPELTVEGSSKLFVDGGVEKRFQYIHTVRLNKLESNKSYVYRCGSKLGWSNTFSFRTPANSSTGSLHLCIFGDMGSSHSYILPYLQKEARAFMYDTIIHLGDLAYDMNDKNGRVGDTFMRQIESVAAYVPYMVCPGNHEEAYNFSHYKERFTMPGEYENMFYSFNLGPVHFISLNTEAYYYLNYGTEMLVNQYNWLVKDLKESNKPENRALRPWIITYGHRPMYCSNVGNPKNLTYCDCIVNTTRVRVGLSGFLKFGLEDLFYEHGVDLEFWAHEHSYERLWPIYDYKVFNGSTKEPYTDPKAPIHITTGSAGSVEPQTEFMENPDSWSAFRSMDFGYTKLHFFNSSHLKIEQLSVDKNGKIIDSFWVIKEKHGIYSTKKKV